MTFAELIARIADLSALTDPELGEVEQQFAAWGAEHGATAEPGEVNQAVEAIDAIRAEAGTRIEAANAIVASRQALASRFTSDPAPVDPDPADPVDPADPEPAPAVFSAADLTAAVTAGVTAALTAATPAPSTVPAIARRTFPASPANSDPAAGALPGGRFPAVITAAANVPTKQLGDQFTSWTEIVEATTQKINDLGPQGEGPIQKTTVAHLVASGPPERTLGPDKQENAWKVAQEIAPEKLYDDLQAQMRGSRGLTASGGLAAPVMPYYGQLVIAEPIRPVRDALEVFMAPRGGIRTVLPGGIGDLIVTAPGSFTDGVSNTDTSFVSASAAFTAADTGSVISASNIPLGTTIASVTNGTTIVLSAATTSTTTGIHFNIADRNPQNLGSAVGVITVAQDAAGVIKTTYDDNPGGQVEYDVQSVYASLQFPNLGARAWPERVEATMRKAQALQARAADSNLLDQITAASVNATLAETFGTARQVLAQLGHAASYYRNHNRTDPEMPLKVLLPAWLLDAMVGDGVSSLVFTDNFYGIGYAEMRGFLEDRNLIISAYVDSSGFNAGTATQLFAAASNNSALPDYPETSSVVTAQIFMFSPGSHLFLDTGVLDLGLIRDSILTASNKFRNFFETFETSGYVGVETLKLTMQVCNNGGYGAASTVICGTASGL